MEYQSPTYASRQEDMLSNNHKKGRTCRFFDDMDVEDERYFSLKCTAYNDLTVQHFGDILVDNISDLVNFEAFIYKLSSKLAKDILNAMKQLRPLVYNRE